MRHSTGLLAAFFLSMLIVLPAASQEVEVLTDDEWCEDENWGRRGAERHCEVREFFIDSRDRLDVDGMKNGGVRVNGWERDEILVRAKVTAQARSEEDARELARSVTIETGATIQAEEVEGASRGGRKAWTSVSYEIFAPRTTALSLTTHNGGVSIQDIAGDVAFDVLNGGVSLTNLAGHVEGKTVNGGLKVKLTGSEWEGEGMDVVTTNGGVKLYIPDDYSAQLETGTVNGHLDFDFPVTLKGRLDRKISTTLGEGGRTIRVRTTNGSVKVQRS